MIPGSVYLYAILANGTPQSVLQLAPTFTIVFMPHRANFLLAVSFFNGAPWIHMFTLYLKLILANCTLESVIIYHFSVWYPAECTATRHNVKIIVYA